MGENFWPYVIEPNRKSLETLFQYYYEQGLSSKHLKIEDLFESSFLEFKEYDYYCTLSTLSVVWVCIIV